MRCAIDRMNYGYDFSRGFVFVSVDGRIVYKGDDFQTAQRIYNAWRALDISRARVTWKVPPDVESYV